MAIALPWMWETEKQWADEDMLQGANTEGCAAMNVEFSRTRAERYALATNSAPEARNAEIQKLTGILQRLGIAACDRIVELGAGHGFATVALTNFLAPNGVVLAVDNSPYMADHIRPHNHIRPMVASFSSLEIETGTAELVVSLATFHHITHKTLVLQEAKRVLLPGGHIVIADVYHETPVQRFFDHVVRKYCSEGHDWDFLDAPFMEILARRVGMRHLDSWVEPTDWRFTDEDTMLKYLSNLTSLELGIADLKPLVDEWLQPQRDADRGSILLPWSLGFHVLGGKSA